MGSTSKILILLLLFLIPAASASSVWTQESITTLKQCNLSCGSDIIRINDFNDDAVFISLIRDNQVIESTILESSALMDDGLIKVDQVRSYRGKRSVIVYSKVVPRFTISTETKESNGKYTSEITINCIGQPAYNVKCFVESGNISFNSRMRDFRLKTFPVDDEIIKKVKYSLDENPEMILNIEYEDDLGNDYVQKFDLLNNLPIKTEVVESEPKTTGYTIIRHSMEYREKEIFYRAIERALNHIDFSEEVETELRSIMEKLTQ